MFRKKPHAAERELTARDSDVELQRARAGVVYDESRKSSPLQTPPPASGAAMRPRIVHARRSNAGTFFITAVIIGAGLSLIALAAARTRNDDEHEYDSHEVPDASAVDDLDVEEVPAAASQRDE